MHYYCRENISDDRISLGLILVKKALDTDSSLDVEECRRHLNEFKYKNIICPFGKKFQALVKFETMEGLLNVIISGYMYIIKFLIVP